VDGTPKVAIADAGYWKTEAIEALVAEGIQTLVAPTVASSVGRAAAPRR
jgi:hypothetical protein